MLYYNHKERGECGKGEKTVVGYDKDSGWLLKALDSPETHTSNRKEREDNKMTRVSYDICKNNRKVKNVTDYEEAQRIVKELGSGWTFRAVYTAFDPEDTPERRAKAAEHRRKSAEYRKAKRSA